MRSVGIENWEVNEWKSVIKIQSTTNNTKRKSWHHEWMLP